ncbi:MAG: PstS family phosphate ABC transporter substrate-binding protein [Muribaculaceae bacterium]
MRKITMSLAMASLTLAMLMSCGKSKSTGVEDTTTSGMTTIVCDQSFQNILNQEIEVFEFQYPNASVIPFYEDESAAIDSLMQMKTRLIITAHELSQEQKDYLKSKNRPARTQRLAVDAIALIVNRDNDIDELTMEDLRDIFSGKVMTWGEITPTKLKRDSIAVVFDGSGSSVTRYMRDSLLNGKPFIKNVYAQGSSDAVFDLVAKRKNALGIVGVSWITADMKGKSEPVEQRVENLNQNDTTTIDFENSRIKVLKVRRDDELIGYKPYQVYIYDARYPLYRSVYVTCTGPVGGLAQGFYCFLTGFIGQKIIQNTGVLPAAIQPRVVSID